MAYSSTHANNEAWLVDSSASFHMNAHREWFCKYERYVGDDIFLGDDSTTKTIGRGKFKLKLMGGRIRIVPSVLHIPRLDKKLIYVRKMDDVELKTMFEKETCRMVQEAMVLLKRVWIGTMYKMQGRTISDGCNSSIVPEIGAEEEKTSTVYGEKTMLWHQRLGHIGEKGFRVLHGAEDG